MKSKKEASYNIKTQIKVFIILSIFLSIFQNCYSQDDWKIYSFDKICSFRIPKTMELRDNENQLNKAANDLIKSNQKKYGETIPDAEMKFQPIGMNSQDLMELGKATSLYARILIAKLSGDWPSQADVKELSLNEIKILGDEQKEIMIKQQRKILQGKDITWLSFKRRIIGNKYALVAAYKRPSPKEGQVYVNIYYFFFKKYLLRITTAFRDDDSSNAWQSDFQKFIDSLKFN